jgi:hypothetical protein
LWPLNNGTDGLGGGKNQRMKERAKEKWEWSPSPILVLTWLSSYLSLPRENHTNEIKVEMNIHEALVPHKENSVLKYKVSELQRLLTNLHVYGPNRVDKV